MNTITKQYLQECFTYDENISDYKWLERPSYHFKHINSQRLTNTTSVNKVVGNIDRQGYITVKLCDETYRLNKLIYLMYYDYLPTKEDYIIHINGNRIDNRHENLKLVNKENNIEIDNTGVYYYTRLNKYAAFVDRGKVRSLIGYYDTEEEAKNIREEYNKNKENNSSVPLPTQQYLQECFTYNPEDGLMYWKERPLHHFDGILSKQKRFNTLFANTLVNGRDDKNYILVPINKKYLKAHRLIWKMYYGEDPKYFIDHINGIADDNRICNLQDISNKENQRKFTKLNKNNTTGYIGVSYYMGAYQANIRDGEGGNLHLGAFETPEEAALMREIQAKKIYGEEFYNKYNEGKIEDLVSKVFSLSKVERKLSNISGYSNVIYHKETDTYQGRFSYNGEIYYTKYRDIPELAYDEMCDLKRELGILKIRYQ